MFLITVRSSFFNPTTNINKTENMKLNGNENQRNELTKRSNNNEMLIPNKNNSQHRNIDNFINVITGNEICFLENTSLSAKQIISRKILITTPIIGEAPNFKQI